MRYVLLIVLLAWSGLSRAETVATCKGYIASVPAVISQGGTWCLDHDVATAVASGSAIDITANNVVLDCNGFKIGGLGAGPATTTVGISATDVLNTVVRNCNIRGFRFGVGMTGGGGRLIERNRIEGSTLAGILLQGAGSTIRDNQVVDTGGPYILAAGISIYDDIDVLDNVVSGVRPTPGTGSSAYGISVASGQGVLARNIVRGVVSGGSFNNAAVYVASTAQRVTIRDNDLMNMASVIPSYGVRCEGGESPTVVTATSLLNFQTPIAGCVDGGRNLEVVP